MGQKTHPKAVRIGITQNHLSNWYAKKANYSSLLRSDFLIRQKIEDIFLNTLTISNIEIFRGGSESNTKRAGTIVVSALHPRFYELSKKAIEDLLLEINKTKNLGVALKKYFLNNKYRMTKVQTIKKLLSYFLIVKSRQILRYLCTQLNQQFVLRFKFLKNSYENASLIAKLVGLQIKNRVPFRRILKQTIKKAQLAGVNGIKLELSGRLNGIDIARSEWKHEGKIPLHTLNAKIDYASHSVNTVYGTIGIKVWIHNN